MTTAETEGRGGVKVFKMLAIERQDCGYNPKKCPYLDGTHCKLPLDPDELIHIALGGDISFESAKTLSVAINCGKINPYEVIKRREMKKKGQGR